MKAEYDALIFSAELGDSETVDLHRMRVPEAIDNLEHVLHRAFMDGHRVVKIIHGGGTGTLRRAILDFLQKETIVEDIRDSSLSHEMGAVTYAVLIAHGR